MLPQGADNAEHYGFLRERGLGRGIRSDGILVVSRFIEIERQSRNARTLRSIGSCGRGRGLALVCGAKLRNLTRKMKMNNAVVVIRCQRPPAKRPETIVASR